MRFRYWPGALAAGVLATALAARGGSAQTGWGGGTDDVPPAIVFEPASRGYSAGETTADVVVRACDNVNLDRPTLAVTQNGHDVRARFTALQVSGSPDPACPDRAWYFGRLDLAAGSNRVEARICDAVGNCRTEAATYTYVADAPPTVAAFEPTGTVGKTVQVAVSWRDDVALDPATARVTLNGTAVAGLAYAGSGGAGSSTGTVTLAPGGNTLVATVCDAAGQCSAPFTRLLNSDQAAPQISVFPGAGSTPDSTRTFAIDWSDASGLDTARIRITWNGRDVTSAFSHHVESSGAGGPLAVRSTGGLALGVGTPYTLRASIADRQGNEGVHTGAYVRLLGPRVQPVAAVAHHPDFRNMGTGAAVLSYSTVPYYSLDAARSLTLFYASEQAYPLGQVEVDAFDGSAEPPARISLQVLRPDGAALSGEVFYAAGNGAHRLAVRWVATGMATGSHPVVAVVRSYWSDGSAPMETRVPTRVVIVNQRASSVAPGWSIAGLQRVHADTAGAAVSGGDGTVRWFRRACPTCSTYLPPDGEFSTLSRMADGGFVRVFPDGARLTFTGAGLLVRSEDRFGRATTYEYAGAKLVRVVDPAGHDIRLSYHDGGAGSLASVAEHGRSSTFHPGENGRIARIVDPDGRDALAVAYDAPGRVTGWTDRAGASWTVAYEGWGTLSRLTGPPVATDRGTEQAVTEFLSMAAAALPAPGWGTSTLAAPRVLPDTLRARVVENGVAGYAAFDRFGLLTRAWDADGRVTEIHRNRHGQDTLTMAPAGTPVRTAWDGPVPVRITTAAGTDTLRYHPQFALLTEKRGTGLQERYWYGELGQLDSADIGGARTRFTYEPVTWRLASVRNAQGATTSYQYQASGLRNLASVTDPRGTTTYERDGFGRETAATSSVAGTARAAYDLMNRDTLDTGALGHRTGTTFGPTFVSGVRDPAGQTYGFTRNVLGWVTAETDPRGQSLAGVHDRGGRVVRSVNRRGQAVARHYDARGRLDSLVADGRTIRIAYDTAGRYTVVSTPESTDTLRTDAEGRVVSQATVRASGTYRVLTAHERAVDGSRGVAVRAGRRGEEELILHHAYAANGLLAQLSPDLAAWTRIEYDTELRVSRITWPSGLAATYAYSHLGELHRIDYNRAAAHAAAGAEYGRDALGRVVQRRRPGAASSTVYRYDLGGRLTHYGTLSSALCGTSGPLYGTTCAPEAVPTWSAVYAYDAVGNRTDRGAQLETGNRLHAFDGWSFTYDADGNLLTAAKPGEAARAYEWNSLGQLTGVSVGGAWTRYTYDGLGRRIRRSGPSGVEEYVYDGDHVVLDVAGGQVGAAYGYLPGIDQPFVMRRGGAHFYYLRDHQGSVAALADAGGNVAAEYRYDPWGRAEHVREDVPNRIRYTGREYDAETGLYHYRARDYDPVIGRFVSEDPIGLEGGINPFAYVVNDPVNHVDPTGMGPECVIIEGLPDGPLVTENCSPELRARAMLAYLEYLRMRARNPARTQRRGSYSYSTQLSDAELIFLGVRARLDPVDEYLNAAAIYAISFPAMTVGGVGMGAYRGAAVNAPRYFWTGDLAKAEAARAAELRGAVVLQNTVRGRLLSGVQSVVGKNRATQVAWDRLSGWFAGRAVNARFYYSASEGLPTQGVWVRVESVVLRERGIPVTLVPVP